MEKPEMNEKSAKDCGRKAIKWKDFRDQYTIEGTRITNTFIRVAVQDELEAFHLQLWGLCAMMEEEDSGNASYARDLVSRFFDIISAVEKLCEFEKFFQSIAEGREIDPDQYHSIDISKILENNSKGEEK